jgi:phenylacetate-CoA ligase
MEHLNNLVRMARQNSSFFAQHFKDINHVDCLEDLPIIDHSGFWAAAKRDRTSVMTGVQLDGFITATGGKTHSCFGLTAN